MPHAPTVQRPRATRILALIGLSLSLLAPVPRMAAAESALIAVAANFAETAQSLAPAFNAETGHELTLTIGSTGKLYAQITKGAPFDALLAADQERPRRLLEEGHAVPGTRRTYATGQLVLWSPDPDRIGQNGEETLANGDFEHLAMANPDLAPYGLAAAQALDHMGLRDRLSDRIVMGQNIGQTFSMVATGNAALGLVAGSYAASPRNTAPGSVWPVPAAYHDPIRQDAVLLAVGADNAAARAFLDYLHSDAAREVITRFGYGVEDPQ